MHPGGSAFGSTEEGHIFPGVRGSRLVGPGGGLAGTRLQRPTQSAFYDLVIQEEDEAGTPAVERQRGHKGICHPTGEGLPCLLCSAPGTRGVNPGTRRPEPPAQGVSMLSARDVCSLESSSPKECPEVNF